MHPTIDHAEFRSLAEKGEIVVGVDPAVARRFFSESQLSNLRRSIGEPIPLECLITTSTFWLAPVLLLASFYFAFQFSGWWSLLVIPGSLVLWYIHMGRVSYGRPGVLLLGAAVALLIWVNFTQDAPGYRWLVLFVASFFFTRIAYRVAAALFRMLVIRNAKVYDLLRDAIYVQAD